MNIFILFLPVAVFLLILHFALSKKSGPLIKKAALITLFILTLSVIISLLLILSGPAEAGIGIPIESVPETPVRPTNTNIPALIFFIILFLFFLVIIIVTTLREYREMKKNTLEMPQKTYPPQN